jgi:hypothetical protein
LNKEEDKLRRELEIRKGEEEEGKYADGEEHQIYCLNVNVTALNSKVMDLLASY